MTRLPQIEAKAQLDAIQAASVAFGSVKAADGRRYVARLERIARGATRPAPATPATLAAMGVAVVIAAPEVSNG